MDKIKEYFASPRVSNSILGMMQNPRLLKLKKENPKLEDEDKKHFRVGSAVDCLLTSAERFDYDFKVMDINRPYGLMGQFVQNLPPGLDYNSPVEMYEEAFVKAGYRMNIQWVIKKFWESADAVGFYEASVNTPPGVTILSVDEMATVQRCIDLIGINPNTRQYFVNTQDTLMHQVAIYFSYRDLDCKALLDGLLINHNEKFIQPFDLKTIGKTVYDFPESFVKGYYRQAAFYTIALNTPQSPVYKLIHEEGYELRNFIFIVVETGPYAKYHPAVIYQTSEKDFEVGVHGGKYNGKIVHGINHLLDEYVWHVTNDYWDMPKELFENNSVMNLDIFE